MKFAVALVILGFAFGSTCAIAQSISISGCAETGVEASCVVMKVDSKVYNITHASPKPGVGKYGTVSGTLSQEADICQQGEILSPSTWTLDPEKKCPADQ